MPELPDILLYMDALQSRIIGQKLDRIRLASPFLVRTVDPPITAIQGRTVRGIERIGKQIVFQFDESFYVVIHLMIAGRFQWNAAGAPIPARRGLAALDFSSGTLLLTEAGSRKRASMHLVLGRDALAAFDRGGIQVLGSSLHDFQEALTRERHTLKRALTDPRLFSGIGNAYSDEILHRARLSPMKLTSQLTTEEIARLHAASISTLQVWADRLRGEAGGEFPSRVTAFHPEMAVHGRYGQPCPDCGSPVQHIVYAKNECNYCATCQTQGRLLADRAMSRLLKEDWPRTIEEWEGKIVSRRQGG